MVHYGVMHVVENNAIDDVEVNLFLQENDAVHETDKVRCDAERFEMVELKMIDLLNQMYEENDDWYETYVH